MGYQVGVLDDHKIVIEGVYRTFENTEHNLVLSANSGTELLQALEKSEIEVLLLDLNIGEDIFKLIRSIKQLYSKIKIIAFTSYNIPTLVSKVKESKVSGYLLKTTSTEEMMLAIEKVMNGEEYVGSDVKIKRMKNSNSIMDDTFTKKNLLSTREIEVLTLIADGVSNRKAAEILFLSENTVETHRKNIKKKLKAETTADLIKYAIIFGIA